MEAVIMRKSERGGGVLQNGEWHKLEGASADALAALKSLVPVHLPESYYSLLAFDLRGNAPYPVVAFDITNIDLQESVRPIAPCFDVALDLIGRDDQ